MARRTTPIARILTVLTATVAGLLLTIGQASAAIVPEPPRPAFYEAPATLPETNGAIVKTEPMTFKVDPAQLSQSAIAATKVMYRSTDHEGDPIAVTGSIIVPKAPWVGSGTRPVIGYAVGTQGLADRCAPSRQFAEGVEYEGAFITGLLARGYAVAITDYEGLGTAGVHTYMNRASQGHTVLDIVRAAQQLPGSGLTPSSPVGLSGYSQGGGAAASAAELAASYAPELQVKGASVGAVPADLGKVMNNLDGGMYFEFALYGLVGLAVAYDIDIDPYLNDAGRQAAEKVQSDCVFDLFHHSFVKSSTLSADGQPFSVLGTTEPMASVIAQNRIGGIKPAMPVLITHSLLDDVIPYQVGRQMGVDWCAKGAKVRMSPNANPSHLGGMLATTTEQYLFFEARFSGLPFLGNCGLF